MLAISSRMRVRMATTVVAFLMVSLSTPGAAFGQIKSGTITGTVTDSAGAVLPGANVSVINQETNVVTSVVTDDTGSFTVPYLTPGKYTVNVEKAGAGFSKYSAQNLTVSTAQTLKIDVELQTGTVTDTITVTTDAGTLQTSSATVQGLINDRIVDAIPNITHNPFSYAALQAGVVPRGLFNNTQSTTSFGIGIDGRRQASAVGINGGSAFSNDILLDGVSIQGSAWNETAVLPNQDALQEVRTITNSYSAEYGRAQGVVIFTTKSGGNEYHGSGFYRIRNEGLNANSFFNNANDIVRGPFRSNTFGGTAGGRIIRDKAFFFASYEGLRFHRAYDFLLTVPTDLERRGDFSKTFVGTLTAPLLVKIYDPFNATRVGNSFQRALLPSQLPNARLNPFGMNILQSYPMPNRTPDNIFNQNNFFLRGNQEFSKNNINSRVDFRQGKHNFYGTYGFQKGNIITPRSWGQDNLYYSRREFVGNRQPDNNFYVAFGDTFVLTPSLIIDARIGVNRIKADNEADAFDNYDYDQFGIPKEIQALNATPGAPPAISLGGGSIVSPLNFGTSLHKRERQTNTDFNASMTWTRGRWIHKFGGTYRVLLSNYIDNDDSSQIQTDASFTRFNVNADVYRKTRGAKGRIGTAITALRMQMDDYRWHYVASKGRSAITTSRFLQPPPGGHVTLDATGALNSSYREHPELYDIIEPAEPTRRYENATWYVNRTNEGTGKETAERNAEPTARKMLAALREHYGKRLRERRVLLVTHLVGEEAFEKVFRRVGFAALATAHWNKLDGRNDWREYDTLVVPTLLYGDRATDVNQYNALRATRLTTAGVNELPAPVRTMREDRVSAALAQAMGRIMRTTVDDTGACAPRDVFVRAPLPVGLVDTNAVIARIERTLPGINTVAWTPVALIDEKVDRRRQTATLDHALLGLADQAKGREIDLTMEKLKGSHGAFHRTTAAAQEPGNPLWVALAVRGYRVVPGVRKKAPHGRPARLVPLR